MGHTSGVQGLAGFIDLGLFTPAVPRGPAMQRDQIEFLTCFACTESAEQSLCPIKTIWGKGTTSSVFSAWGTMFYQELEVDE